MTAFMQEFLFLVRYAAWCMQHTQIFDLYCLISCEMVTQFQAESINYLRWFFTSLSSLTLTHVDHVMECDFHTLKYLSLIT